ncbi:hypothetical protein [Janthinobacterium sp. HLX7-2]|uniref:hypothetical protein n=1 Tax=Janthinobacterium sp. HLX7-2 TaxID=1259331 RepID=UPI003F2077AC
MSGLDTVLSCALLAERLHWNHLTKPVDFAAITAITAMLGQHLAQRAAAAREQSVLFPLAA